ncbi:hypothetical protein Q765_02630 [Flavobacterium rivuli WB 3.3-2 = DSM 21788]|uniref:DUF4890 domain-containing protein n=1 Tax=Flavobacterium rivuli WB 3.3-2 = DSM 21788 TaxID=1121895 RepID=A0A0A2M6R2_9FLAO|nr:hypothetical protein [Flavobacterium rivuli]KGO87979.1 hypothetical protein Q765_02630 [Flavobacterium rivuli WB 3.3-2 = DSM 21788]
MKKIVMGLLLLAAIGSYAQEKPVKQSVKSVERPIGDKIKNEKKLHKVTPDEQAKQIAKELNLNDIQQAKVKVLYEEQEKNRAALAPELKKMEKGEQHDHAAMEKKMKEENTAFDTKMKNILSKEQYVKWQESLKKNHSNMGLKKIETIKKS